MSCRSIALCCAVGAALALSSCGYVGIELQEAALDASLPPVDADVRLEDASLLSLDGHASFDAANAACDLSGSWAVKVELPLSWPGGLIQSGSGTATLWLRYQGSQSGNAWSGSAQACGITLPDFQLNSFAGDETYGMRVPDALFDRAPAYIAPFASTITVGGTSRAGDPLTIEPAGLTIGATLSNPLSDFWVDNSLLESVDTDLDGEPGITMNYARDANHVYPPLNFTRTQRAARAYVAVRFAFHARGAIASCNELDGPVTFTQFDTHILGCAIDGGGSCGVLLTEYLDDNRPNYNASPASYRAIRVPADTSCAQIRTTLLP